MLQPRRRAERALLGVVPEACVPGVSTRKIDDVVTALGLDGMPTPEVSRNCRALDPLVEAFRTRPIASEHPYARIDATCHKVRIDGRVVSQATVVAIGVTREGDRQILGVDIGPSEEGSFWTAFLRSLMNRGLTGVRLVISDAHEGLKQAIKTVFRGASGSAAECILMRSLPALVPQRLCELVAAIVRTIFAQPDHARAMGQLQKVADGRRKRLPAAATRLEEAADDILAHKHFPDEHRRPLHSANPLERLNKEIKRRSNVVGIFPSVRALVRLVGAILQWLLATGIDTALIDPGKPWQNGTDESFNGKFRDECLNIEWFRTRPEATTVIEQWRRHYNEVRPHSSLGYLTPQEFREQNERQHLGDDPSTRDAILQ